MERYSPTPYLATLINCMVWTLYGLPMVHPHSILVVTINGSGTAIELVYIFLFLIFCDKQKRLKVLVVLLVEFIFTGALVALVLTLAHSHKERSMIVGIICILFNVLMYASPLSVMKMVITTKSVEYMPFFLSLACLANGIAWTTYALIGFDPFILVPNGVGSVFSLAQLILYAAFYKSTQRQIAERKSQGQVALSDVVVDGEDPKSASTAP